MRLPIALLIITTVCTSAMEIAGPNAGTAPGQPGQGGMPMGGSMSRPAMTFEVELVVIKSDTDQIGLARWAELAAAGYRLSQVINDGAKQWVYLERAVMGTPTMVHLPALIEQDRAGAEALRAKIQAAANERMQALRAQPPIGGTPAPVTK